MPGIGQLIALEELDLSENRIKTLPQDLSKLKHLKKLQLGNCEITELGPGIGQLISLKELDLSCNIALREIPLSFSNLKHLQTLEVKGNLMLQQPPHGVCQQGVEAVFSYFAELRLAKAIHQKVVLLGCSGAGKTSLARTLIRGQPSCVEKEDRTIVLDRIPWEPTKEEKSLSVCLIDFGGSEWYKIVHHLFIDRNALFLLVVNLAEYLCENFERDIGSWLKLLLTRVSSPHWRLVATHADQCTREDIEDKCKAIKVSVRCVYERQGLEIGASFEILVTSSENMDGIGKLQEELVIFVNRYGKVIPAAWLELFKKLQSPVNKSRPCFHPDEVMALDQEVSREGFNRYREDLGDAELLSDYERSDSKDNESEDGPRKSRRLSRPLRQVTHFGGAPKKSSQGTPNPATASLANKKKRLESILEFFHDIGAILWYQYTPELSKFIFHNPDYLTSLLKAIFTERLETESLCYVNFKSKFSVSTFEHSKNDLLQRGIMSRDLLECLWKHKGLSEEVVSAMIDLFMQMDLCYTLRIDRDRVTSLRFPWFLAEEAPDDAELQRILFGPTAVNSHRITFEYEFLSICPPPMYEKFSVRMHRHIDDKPSRRDWKNGFRARMYDSHFVVQKFHRELETVISFTVAGEDVIELWEVLTELKKEMQNVMTEWPGVKFGSHYNTFTVCPHCVQLCTEKPVKFKGENVGEECKPRTIWMTCTGSSGDAKIPACLLFKVNESSFHTKHKKALQQFVETMNNELTKGACANELTREALPSTKSSDEKPTEAELRSLSLSINAKYMDVGVKLGVPVDVVENIEGNFDYRAPRDRAFQVLMYWLRSSENPTCEQLAKVLGVIGRCDLARKLRLKEL